MLARENVSYRVLENHPQDSRIKIKDDGIFQTMGARGGARIRTSYAYGFGGNRNGISCKAINTVGM